MSDGGPPAERTRSDNGATEERQRSARGATEELQRSDRGATAKRQRRHRRAAAEQQRSDRGATAKREKSGIGATEERQRSDREATPQGATDEEATGERRRTPAASQRTKRTPQIRKSRTRPSPSAAEHRPSSRVPEGDEVIHAPTSMHVSMFVRALFFEALRRLLCVAKKSSGDTGRRAGMQWQSIYIRRAGGLQSWHVPLEEHVSVTYDVLRHVGLELNTITHEAYMCQTCPTPSAAHLLCRRLPLPGCEDRPWTVALVKAYRRFVQIHSGRHPSIRHLVETSPPPPPNSKGLKGGGQEWRRGAREGRRSGWGAEAERRGGAGSEGEGAGGVEGGRGKGEGGSGRGETDKPKIEITTLNPGPF